MDRLTVSVIYMLTIGAIHGCCTSTVNLCAQPVSPGIPLYADSAHLSTTGFVLHKGGSKIISVPSSWGRSHYTQDLAGKSSGIIGNTRNSREGESENKCAKYLGFSPKREWLQAPPSRTLKSSLKYEIRSPQPDVPIITP